MEKKLLFITIFLQVTAIEIDVTLPEVNPGCSKDEVGYKPHPGDCTSFISCNPAGVSWIMSCPRGLWYDPQKKICDYDHYRLCTGGRYYVTRQSMSPRHLGPRLDTPVPIPVVIVEEPTTTVKPDVVSEAVVFLSGIRSDLMGLVSDRLRQEAVAAVNIKDNPWSAFHTVQILLGSLGPARELSIPAQFQLEGLSAVKKQFFLDKQDTEKVIEKLPNILDLAEVPFKPGMEIARGPMTMCPFPLNSDNNRCGNHDRYRTIDGSCNNIQRPLWGKSFVSLSRFLPPDYADGIGAPRVGRNGDELVSARTVSLTLFDRDDNLSPVFNVMFMTFGQFLDHDLARTAVTRLSRNVNGTGSLVGVPCGSSGCETAGPANRACFPISLPQNDPDFSDRRCLKFVRTQETVTSNCNTVSRQQLNQITSYIDSSNVYGSTVSELSVLREQDRSRGRLKVTQHDRGLKPLLPTQRDGCSTSTSSPGCFVAGDSRVNEQVGLTAMHTVWHRFHNHLEERLHHINPHWTGERLFQESRKILIAVWQFIIYNEYLPVVLGPRLMKLYGLTLNTEGYYDGYNDKINVDIGNVFQTAAFRFGHSQIPSLLRFVSSNYQHLRDVHLTDTFSRPNFIYSNNAGESAVDSILLGMASQATQRSDNSFTDQVSRSLFTDKPPRGLGTDLPALNIQRGRDHGIPGYNVWRKWCDLKTSHTFEDLHDIPPKLQQRLKKLYRNVEDIDLYAGGMLEKHMAGAAVGPTFACIIARQFQNLKVGDRFWHERNDTVTGFTSDQLQEIRKVTLAKVLCATLDNVETIQKFVLMLPMRMAFKNLGSKRYMDAYNFHQLYKGEDNERRPCQYLDDLDLFKWWDNEERSPRPVPVRIPLLPVRRWYLNYVEIPRPANLPLS